MKQKIKKYFEKNIDGIWTVGEGTTKINIITKKAGVLSQYKMMKLKIGFKAIIYNFDYNTKVKLETFVGVENEEKGPYVKLHEKIDDGK